jgi:hypothetical protein
MFTRGSGSYSMSVLTYLALVLMWNAAEESVKKLKSSHAEPLVLPQLLNLAAGEQFGIEKVVFRNPPAVIMPAPASAPAPAPAMGPGQSFAPTTTAAPVPPPVVIIEEPRQPPPVGQPVLKRLPSELVGDLLQVRIFDLHSALRPSFEFQALIMALTISCTINCSRVLESSRVAFIQIVHNMTWFALHQELLHWIS